MRVIWLAVPADRERDRLAGGARLELRANPLRVALGRDAVHRDAAGRPDCRPAAWAAESLTTPATWLVGLAVGTPIQKIAAKMTIARRC